MTSASTTLSAGASRRRVGVLLVALALVGGTGCITASVVESARYRQVERDREARRQADIAALAPAAEAGDPAAQTRLALALLAVPPPGQVDQQRVFARLNPAAEHGYGLAQALLGHILVTNSIEATGYRGVPLADAYRDRERGIRLLKLAATQACRYSASTYLPSRWIAPAMLLATSLDKTGRFDEALLWRARAVLHCNVASANFLPRVLAAQNTQPEERIQEMALLLLTGDSAGIAQAEAALPADALAAARQLSKELREKVAQSEREYPAPQRKVIQ